MARNKKCLKTPQSDGELRKMLNQIREKFDKTEGFKEKRAVWHEMLDLWDLNYNRKKCEGKSKKELLDDGWVQSEFDGLFYHRRGTVARMKYFKEETSEVWRELFKERRPDLLPKVDGS